MKVELQDVDPRDQKKYEKKVNDLERRLKKAQQELRAAKNSSVSPPARAPCSRPAPPHAT
jgi:ABC-type Zn uptake system ZnuABC Zn-binding protein ZnuA